MSIAEFPDQLAALPALLRTLITLSPSPTAVPGFLARFPQDFGRDEPDTFVIWALWMPIDGGILEATPTFLGLSPDLPSAVMEMLAGLQVGTSVWLIPRPCVHLSLLYNCMISQQPVLAPWMPALLKAVVDAEAWERRSIVDSYSQVESIDMENTNVFPFQRK